MATRPKWRYKRRSYKTSSTSIRMHVVCIFNFGGISTGWWYIILKNGHIIYFLVSIQTVWLYIYLWSGCFTNFWKVLWSQVWEFQIYLTRKLSMTQRNQVNCINPSRPDPERREKINWNFYIHTCLWCLKAFIKHFEAP